MNKPKTLFAPPAALKHWITENIERASKAAVEDGRAGTSDEILGRLIMMTSAKLRLEIDSVEPGPDTAAVERRLGLACGKLEELERRKVALSGKRPDLAVIVAGALLGGVSAFGAHLATGSRATAAFMGLLLAMAVFFGPRARLALARARASARVDQLEHEVAAARSLHEARTDWLREQLVLVESTLGYFFLASRNAGVGTRTLTSKAISAANGAPEPNEVRHAAS